MDRRFLTAEWRLLLLLNYEVEPGVLEPLVPRGTELDAWDGRTLVSLVGFRFLRTAVLGVPVPGHRAFDEVNLRFYVRRRAAGGPWRRGVVFLRELVPKRLVAWTARLLYHEPYRRVPMTHAVDLGRRAPGAPGRVEYGWRHRGRRCRLSGELHAPLLPLRRSSEAEFVTEHYWGYSRQRDGRTLEYEVRHPPWQVTDVTNPRFEGTAAAFHGAALANVLSGPPRSAFFADGSPVVVFRGRRIPAGDAAVPE
jgi:uncharacterized protein YqjF (DUF2071 family)